MGGGEMGVGEVEQTSLSYSRELGFYLREPSLKRLRHTKVIAEVIHFRRRGVPFSFMTVHECKIASCN